VDSSFSHPLNAYETVAIMATGIVATMAIVVTGMEMEITEKETTKVS